MITCYGYNFSNSPGKTNISGLLNISIRLIEIKILLNNGALLSGWWDSMDPDIAACVWRPPRPAIVSYVSKCFGICVLFSYLCYLFFKHTVSHSGTQGCIISPDLLCFLGWRLLRQFPQFRYFANVSASPEYILAIVYHVHIWQVSPQLGCGDTCQIWM